MNPFVVVFIGIIMGFIHFSNANVVSSLVSCFKYGLQCFQKKKVSTPFSSFPLLCPSHIKQVYMMSVSEICE